MKSWRTGKAMMARLRAGLGAGLGIGLLAACSPQQEGSALRYEANIRWTSYGIPHVLAADWGGLGYGFAYATARDAVCTIARDVLMVNGELSRFEGPDGGNLQSDIFHRAVLDDAMISAYRAGQTEQSIDFSAGYVAGYNRFLRDNAGSLPVACVGAEWVRPINAADVDRLTVGVGIRYGLARYQQEMANAAPPGQTVAKLDSDFELPAGIGSNAVALGSELTGTGRGLLLGNPHYPWQGSSRFHMIHTTIPGEVDVMGVSLYTTNRVAIGFNADIAWSHTVSTGLRSTLYALELDPQNPTRYRYGEGFRDLEQIQITVPVQTAAGNLETEEHTVYMSHYGPVLVSNQLPWTSERAYAIRDANLYNDRSAVTYDAINKARSIDELEAALHLQGVAWVNTIAADRQGTAYYADISTVPNVDAELFADCRLQPEGISAQVVVLNGTDPACEWREDSRSAIPGTMPAEEMPRLRRTDYVQNANDSYWLANPEHPLTGYSPIIGSENAPVTLRTRAGLHFIDEVLQQTAKVTPEKLQAMLFSQRNYAAELLLDEVLQICEGDVAPVMVDGQAVDIARSCSVLAAWDRRAANSSR
ncbi:MAG: penicillin acylase family protein, partial [Pseudomonadales bacterium]|nr:penicillin acylase family protein [Pseudomonadales bacterium]